MSMGIKIQKIRIEKGYSQELVAEQLGVSRQAISKWENDISCPSTDNLIQLSNFFDTPITELTADNDFSNTSNKSKNIIYPSEKTYKKRFKYIRNISWLIGIIMLGLSIAYLKDMEISYGIALLGFSLFCLVSGYRAQVKWSNSK